MSIIQACGFTLGMGGGSLVSVRLGQKRDDEANQIASTAFFTAIAIGASETILPYAHAYARYIFWGAPVMCASFVLNNVLHSEGIAFLILLSWFCGEKQFAA